MSKVSDMFFRDASVPPALEVLGDLPVRVSVVIGSVRMSMAQLLRVQPGDHIALDRTLDEPVDVYVNDTLVARGDVVLENQRVGVRITEIVRGNDA